MMYGKKCTDKNWRPSDHPFAVCLVLSTSTSLAFDITPRASETMSMIECIMRIRKMFTVKMRSAKTRYIAPCTVTHRTAADTRAAQIYVSSCEPFQWSNTRRSSWSMTLSRDEMQQIRNELGSLEVTHKDGIRWVAASSMTDLLSLDEMMYIQDQIMNLDK
jgi:hypothetical protein